MPAKYAQLGRGTLQREVIAISDDEDAQTSAANVVQRVSELEKQVASVLHEHSNLRNALESSLQSERNLKVVLDAAESKCLATERDRDDLSEQLRQLQASFQNGRDALRQAEEQRNVLDAEVRELRRKAKNSLGKKLCSIVRGNVSHRR
ncbi:hypothetical protein BDN70DRAFT_938154 [Pholiota conissans]|uniref:Uncharacterized protein n=1 Tax=Pholiota conissans TaxID=109636 RepID=A0A9P6CMN1_9AGAR|nr:hypothetical protein BDN70DRAFT_938154 [Pholiota conissans]